jgi:hypothetical protein
MGLEPTTFCMASGKVTERPRFALRVAVRLRVTSAGVVGSNYLWIPIAFRGFGH